MWISKTIGEVCKELNVDPSVGLSEEEALIRLAASGLNKLGVKKKKSIFSLFFRQLNDWLIYVLIAAVIITLIMGEYADVIIISLVIIVNAGLGVLQEVKAGKAIDALHKLFLPKAIVRRDGITKNIDSEKVVPGDILILTTGQFISADIRLIETLNLEIEESALTGESVPSQKDSSFIADSPDTPTGDMKNCAYMSTTVTAGRGVGVVTGTGMNTLIGNIANSILSEEKSKTPLELRLEELGKTIGKFAVAICIIIFGISFLQGRDITEMFLMAVSLAVAAIPEGLAAIVAVVLSIGVTRMAKKNAIIRRLPAVETLGSVNIICSDKTGTLTQNRMTVTSCFDMEEKTNVVRGEKNDVSDDLVFMSKAFILCSDASYDEGKGTGDPTEIALLLLGDDFGIDRKLLLSENKRESELPFDSVRMMMSTLVSEKGNYTVYTKGAIFKLLEISTQVLVNGKVIPFTDEHREKFLEAADSMSDQALRTLGVAYKNVEKVVEASEMEKGLIMIGIAGMIDPPRESVKVSIQQAKGAGIKSIMITGDHKNTAFAIAYELGIADEISQAVTGRDIDKMSEKEFFEKVNGYTVFARVSPEHKVLIVKALKSHGNIVSMTGDGINDAPALNIADIGVAMGITGTDVAKGASDLILTDDNYATIVSAVEQGRNIYNNIKKSVVFLLTCNLGEVISVFFTLMLGWKAPLLATQLLWINLLTDSLPAISLGMDPGNHDVMKEKPRKADESLFAGGTGFRVILGGIFIGVLTIIAYWYGYYEKGYSPFDGNVPEETIEYARTMAFMVIVISQLCYAYAVRSRSVSVFSKGVFSNNYLNASVLIGIGLQLSVVGIPALQKAFNLQMLDAKGWIMCVILGIVPLLLNEIVKIFVRANSKKA